MLNVWCKTIVNNKRLIDADRELIFDCYAYSCSTFNEHTTSVDLDGDGYSESVEVIITFSTHTFGDKC